MYVKLYRIIQKIMLESVQMNLLIMVKLKGSVNSLASLIISGNIPLDLAIKSSSLSKDEFLSIALRL